MRPQPTFDEVANSSFNVLGRLVNLDQTVTKIADLSAISRRATNLTTGASTTTSLSPATHIFDTLQTGLGWDASEGGFNFKDVLSLSTAGWYSITYTFIDNALQQTSVVVSGRITAVD